MPAHDTPYFDSLPDVLDRARGILGESRFDAIVVDEGQDLDAVWWIPLLDLLRDRALVVSPTSRSIGPGWRRSARSPRRAASRATPGDVPLRAGEAGQTRDGVILTSQLRTISVRRVRSAPLGVVQDSATRRAVRAALAHHIGLDIPAIADGARS